MEQPRRTAAKDSDATPGGASWVFLIAAAIATSVITLALAQIFEHGSS